MSASYEIERLTGEDAQRGVIRFTGPLEADAGLRIREQLLPLIDAGCTDWEFNLEGLRTADSVTLGAWVGLNATVRGRGGRIQFVMRADSELPRTFRQLNLHRILDVIER